MSEAESKAVELIGIGPIPEAVQALDLDLSQPPPLIFNLTRPHPLIDILPAAIYLTDAAGRIT